MVTDTSIQAYREKKDQLKRQRERLFQILQDHPEGINDRQASEIMNVPPSTIAARRRDIHKAMNFYPDFKLVLVHKNKDAVTNVRVQHWAIIRARHEQGVLFNVNELN